MVGRERFLGVAFLILSITAAVFAYYCFHMEVSASNALDANILSLSHPTVDFGFLGIVSNLNHLIDKFIEFARCIFTIIGYIFVMVSIFFASLGIGKIAAPKKDFN